LAENYNTEDFVKMMNKKAKELDMTDTNFVDPSGISSQNTSNIIDLIKLTQYALKKPPLWKILKTPKDDVRSADGQFDHRLDNTNTLLKRMPDIIGGKTGYTEEAGGCMILVTKSPKENNENYLIAVVLGADDRFVAIETLINWAKKAYIWK